MKINKLIIPFLIFVTIFTTFSFAENSVLSQESSQATSQADLKIYSDAVILIENKTGKTLYEKNSEQKMYPASTTKILTAILAIEKGNLNDTTTVSKTALAEMKSGYSSAYLVEGETLTIEQLLTVLLVHSANDASNVLAEYISGSISSFVDLMNEKAQELGCTNTHFVTTNGLHDDNHYTTAKDMSIIARYCMKNETFRKIVSMQKCTIPATNKSGVRSYPNTNDMVISSSAYYYPGCIGIKTGFTSEAKNCLISATSKNGLQLIAVVFGAELTENRRSARYVDSKTLYDYGYENYSIETIAKKDTVVDTIQVKGATKETKSLDLVLQNDISSLVSSAEKDKTYSPEINLNEKITAPLAANTVVGTATYTIDGEKYTTNLLASHEVTKSDYLIWILRIGLVTILFFLVLFAIIATRKKSKH